MPSNVAPKLHAVVNTPPHEPEAPRPLRRPLPPAEPFPDDALGARMSGVAHAIHARVQAPFAICAQSILSAATLATQLHADIELPTGHIIPISNYFLTIAESGARKTAADREALAGVKMREEELRLAYGEDKQAHDNKREAWERQRQQILSDKKHFPTAAAKEGELNKLGPEPEAPLHPTLTCTDPTFEGLVKLLQGGQPTVGVFTTEGGHFIGGHALNEDNRLKTGAAMSDVWDGSPIKRIRSGDGIVILNGRRVAMHLMVQPAVANRLMGDPTLRDQGLLSRVLAVAPESIAGSRHWKEPTPEGAAVISEFADHIHKVLQRKPRTRDNEDAWAKPRPKNELRPFVLKLAPEARQKWIEFSDAVELQLGAGGMFSGISGISGFSNKLAEHAARLAAVIATVDDPDRSEVPFGYMAAGISLAQHYAAEALRLTAAGHDNPDLALADRVLAWLSTWENRPPVNDELDDQSDANLIDLTAIYQFGPPAVRDAARAKAITKILAEHGWLSPVSGGAKIHGVYRRNVWRVWRPQKEAER